MKGKLFVVLTISCMIACKTTKITNAEATVFRTEPHILFAGFEFENDKLIVTNKLITGGQLKPAKAQNYDLRPKDISLVQLDSNSKVLREHPLKNPRIRTLEYANDDGNFVKKDEELPDAQFNFRIQLENNTERIEVREITIEKHITLISLKLEDS